MKKSNKILLYGLLASILLILLCLYTHKDEFMIQKKELLVESENSVEALNNSTTIGIEKSKPLPKTESKEEETKKQKYVDVPVNNVTVIEATEENKTEATEENKTEVTEENSTALEENSSNSTTIRTIFKNKEEIKLKEHPKVEKPKKKIEEVDKNLPIEDNKPLIDNDKSVKKKDKNKEVKEEKKKPVKAKSISKKATSTKSIAALQESISTMTNRNISFYKNKAKITDKSRATLNKVINVLKTVPNAKIVVKGYTDASGKEKTNLWISQERAKSVKKYLVKHGIPAKNIVAKGYGESELLYGDKPNSELNRRVTIEIKRK
jgi:outer membrane protein OmpA-like peptidoglycan-associated protein